MVALVAARPELSQLGKDKPAAELDFFAGCRALVGNLPGVGDLLRKGRAERAVEVLRAVPSEWLRGSSNRSSRRELEVDVPFKRVRVHIAPTIDDEINRVAG